MIVLLKEGADPRPVEAELVRAGSGARRVTGKGRLAVESIAPHAPLGHLRARLLELDGVEAVLLPDEPLPKTTQAKGPVLIGELAVGGGALVFAFGPCAVEDEPGLRLAARGPAGRRAAPARRRL